MTVAIDARMIHHSGIGTHLRGLLDAIARRDDRPPILLLGPPDLLAAEPAAAPFDHVAFDAPIYGGREQASFPRRALRRRGVSVVHSPHYNMPLWAGGLRRVVTIHDLIHLRFGDHLSRAARLYARTILRRVARRADRLLTVSEHTRRDLAELLGIPPDRVTVIPNAVADPFHVRPSDDVVAAMRARLGLPERYLLTVGINKPHKNYPFLVRAMAKLWASAAAASPAAPPLVMAGIPPDDAPPLRAIACEAWREAGGARSAPSASTSPGGDHPAASRLLFPGHVAWHDLPALFAGADLLVVPSLYEGFGLPVLEAQALGLAVAAARATSLPEVGGDAASYFDPRDADDAARVIGDLCRDDARRRDLAARGPANAARFSWDRSADALLGVYRDLLARPAAS